MALALACAAYSHVMRPPQQKPVIAARDTSAAPDALANARVASRSLITCASGTFDTTLLRISLKSVIFETPPWRTNSSGATAK